MDITKKHNTEIYEQRHEQHKDEQHGHHQKT